MSYKPELWAEAKRKCRLNEDDIRMAKEMGLNPKSLIKNIPSPKEQWKAPVKDWIRDMYEKRQEKSAKKAARKAKAQEQASAQVQAQVKIPANSGEKAITKPEA